MKILIVLGLWLMSVVCTGQSFDRPAKEAVKLPHPVFLQLKEHLEKNEGYPVMPEKFTCLPTFNILDRSERQFVDGIYYFIYGSHDSGIMFINHKGKIAIFPSDKLADALNTYSSFLKKNALPEVKQIEYLSAIAAFLEYHYQDQQALIKSGAVLEKKN